MDTPCVAAPVRSGGRSEPALARVEAALASSRPACTIYAYSYSEHVLQIYAGLYALHQAGLIRVRQRFAAQDLQRRLSPALLDKPFASRSLNGVFVDVGDW